LGISGLFDGEHIFTLEPVDGGRTRLRQREVFTGVLVPLLARSLDDGTKKGSRPRGGQSFIYSRTLYRHYPTREALFESAYRNEIKGLCDEAPRLFEKHRPD
jgi:hypothetical protein